MMVLASCSSSKHPEQMVVAEEEEAEEVEEAEELMVGVPSSSLHFQSATPACYLYAYQTAYEC